MDKKKWFEDLDYFKEKLEHFHPNLYRNYDREIFIKKFTEVKEINNKLTKSNMLKQIAYLTSLLKDAHTYIDRGFLGYKMPISFEMINDKLYITSVDEINQQALFKEVISINNKSIMAVLKELEHFIVYETSAFREFQIEQTLRRPLFLKILNIINSDVYEIGYKNNGQTNKIAYKYEQAPDYSKLIKPMIYSNKVFKRYYCRRVDNSKTLYINYFSCHEDENYKMEKFLSDINKELESNIDKVIVDIRQNQGGNAMVIKPIIKRLESFNGKIFCLVDKGTFSAAMFALLDLKNLGAIVIGGQTGGSIDSRFGEVEKFQLPNSKIIVTCSTRTFEIKKDKVGKYQTICDSKEEKTPSLPMASFPNDYEIYNTIENLRVGEDIVINKVLNYEKGKIL